MGSIKDFYAGHSIFITGASGFIGKVLVEKFLRAFPDLVKVYILVRAKKGKTAEERVQGIINTPLFDKLRNEHPDVISKKLVPVLGDLTELGLGLSDADKKLLIENVTMIFNGAASVRFDDTLKEAVLLNTRGTREVINLGLQMKKLQMFLHISTTYCHVDKREVGEHSYPAPADWRKTVAIAESIDTHTLQILMNKYMDVLPNSYTFTKALAEHVVTDLCKGKIPAVVFRPSIVISSRNDPIPGWVDNFNGPVGLLVACGKGILRTSYTNPNVKADYMPVDTTVRSILMAAWTKGTTKDPEEKLDVAFYNCSNNGMYTLTMKQLIELGEHIFWDAPLSNILWYPGGGLTMCKTWNYIRVILFHLLPALFVDGVLRLTNNKPMLVKIQRRIYIANMALQHFIINQWTFLNEKCLSLDEQLIPDDVEEFGYDKYTVNVYEYFKNCIIHGRVYLLKEDPSNTESAKKNLYRMYLLDRFVRVLLVVFLIWMFFYKLDGPTYIKNKFYDLLEIII